ncbi:TetR family transcriptional regulator [Oleidesulfovibrio sp.]|uniref:TetR family transcriptional regulator n=1 Tax=Oleidesulfovibrio sp. TaxID=2909707 RepID=UPI003A88C6A9
MARKTKEEAEKTRQLLLDCALTVFLRKGYSATTLNDIAEEANLTRGAVYWHFKNKVDIFSAVLDQAFAPMSRLVRHILERGGNACFVLQEVLQHWMLKLAVDETMQKALDLVLTKTEQNDELAEHHAQMIQQDVEFINNLTAVFSKGIDSGELRADIDPKVGAATFMTLCMGLARLSINHPDAIDMAKHCTMVSNIFFCGVKSQGCK